MKPNTVTFLLSCFLFFSLGCSKYDSNKTKGIKKIHKDFSDGFISECQLDEVLVYLAGHNAYDAGNSVYNVDGELMGICNYAWGKPDTICLKLTNCETVYCIPDNIWGKEETDNYDLGYK